MRLFVPRSDDTSRPFDLSVSDVDVLVELKPEGKVRGIRLYESYRVLTIHAAG